MLDNAKANDPMKIEKLTFIPHRLKRRGRWQTASYTADFVDVFYVKIQTDDGVTGIGAGSVVPTGAAIHSWQELKQSKPQPVIFSQEKTPSKSVP